MSMFQVGPDPDRSLVREGGAFVRTACADEIRQDLDVSVRILRGEIPWDLLAGFDWLGSLGKTPPEILASRLRAYMSTRPGVVEILSLEVVDLGDRRVTIPYRARVSVDALRRAVLVEDTLTVELAG